MIPSIIQRTDGLPSFYSLKARKRLGHVGNAWSEDRNEALAFATAEDAQDFIDAFLLQDALFCAPAPHQRKA